VIIKHPKQRFRFTKEQVTEIAKAMQLMPWSEEASMFVRLLELDLDLLQHDRRSVSGSKKRGRPLKEAERRFAASLAGLFDSVLNKRVGIGRTGPYARVLSMCLHTSDPLVYARHGAAATRPAQEPYLTPAETEAIKSEAIKPRSRRK
jgi:hypothetical protein